MTHNTLPNAMNALRVKGKIACVALAVFLSSAVLGQTPNSSNYESPSVKAVQTFESMRGNPVKAVGYYFSVSPDERWLATLSHAERGAGNVLTVVYAPTGKTWKYAFVEETLLSLKNWLPNCFSADSSTIMYGAFAAKLSEPMRELVFAKYTPDRSDLKRGIFLGFNGRLLNSDGQAVESWFGLDQDEGEFGELSWSADGKTQYRSVAQSDKGSSALKVSSIGKKDAKFLTIDYSRILQLEAIRRKEAAAKIRDTLPKEGALPPEARKAMEQQLAEMEILPANAVVRLAQLALAPTGEYLSGVATLYAEGEIGFGGQEFGVLLQLNHGERLTAYPFAQNVYGNMLWARDAQALYYYSQPESGQGQGTVSKLQLKTVKRAVGQ